MIAFLKKFALGYILSAYLPEKEEQKSSSFFDYFIKLFNVYTSFQLVNEYQDYIKLTMIFSILILLTFCITCEVTIRTTRPLLNIILLIWFICEIIFLHHLLKYYYINVFRVVIGFIYLLIFIVQYFFNNKMMNKKQSLELKEKEILIKTHEARIESDSNNKVLIINNIILNEQLKSSGVIGDNKEFKIENKEKTINKSTKKIKEKEENSRDTPEMKRVRELNQQKKKNLKKHK